VRVIETKFERLSRTPGTVSTGRRPSLQDVPLSLPWHPWALDGVAPLDLSAGTAMNSTLYKPCIDPFGRSQIPHSL
jgi:hypothetical protein